MLKKMYKRLRSDGLQERKSRRDLEKAQGYDKQKRWRLAIRHYERYLSQNPDFTEVWISMGRAFQFCGQLQRAVESYKRAIELNSIDYRPFYFASQCLRRAGETDVAFEMLLDAYKLNPDGPAREEVSQLIGLSEELRDFLDAVDELFDENYYLNVNVDIRSAGVDPKSHYLLYGWREDRHPSPYFDPTFYKTKHKKLLKGYSNPLVHYWRHGRALKLRSNPSGSGLWFSPSAPSPQEWSLVPPAVFDKESTTAVVIVPVYKGYDETLRAIYQVLRARCESSYSVLVVNDCGPDAKLNEELARISTLGLFDYAVNEKNLGFVQTCNRGILELSSMCDVVLLNSDAYVFDGWFERIQAHAARDGRIGTITPLSNNATICSYPLINNDNFKSLEVSPGELDAIAATTNAGMAVETPTGVGFCFYMSRKCISEVGALDPIAFKLGYGEENDFCMRSLEKGFKNIIATDVFAYHVGSVSFSAIKEENFKAGQLALERKHPNYPALVARHVSAKPTRYHRQRLDRARLLRSAKNCIVFVTHTWGGGIQTYLEAKKRQFEAEGKKFITLIVRDRHFVSVDASDSPFLFIPNLADIDLRVEFDFICELISGLNPDMLHINSFAGIEWQHHRDFLNYITGSGIPYTFVAHDYAAISRFYHMTRPDLIYSGLPTWETLSDWSRMTDETTGEVCDVESRRAVYSSFLRGAEIVEFPSKAAKQVFEQFYSEFRAEVVPHTEPFETPLKAKRRPVDGKLRIACIGAIGPHKGSDVLVGLALDTINRQLPLELVVVGYTDNDEAMKGAGVKVTGPYSSESEAINYLLEFEPDLVFISSIWPETYCYTLSIAIALRLPFIVFDLGAQAERARMVNWSEVIDPRLINDIQGLSDFLVTTDVDRLWRNADGGFLEESNESI